MEINKELKRLMRATKKGTVSKWYANGEVTDSNILIISLASDLYNKYRSVEQENRNEEMPDFVHLNYKCKSMYEPRFDNKTHWVQQALDQLEKLKSVE